MKAQAIGNGLFRVLIPYEEVTTTVYLVTTEQGTVIVDSATYPSDVDDYILPALDETGVPRERVRCLLLTHDHADHAGGIARLADRLPQAVVRASFALPLPNATLLQDGDMILDTLRAVHLPGHTPHSVGYLDIRTRTLLSGDCLQLAGVGKYRSGIVYPHDYITSCERLKTMGIERIVAAHEYDPYGSVASGAAAVMRYLDACIAIARGEGVG